MALFDTSRLPNRMVVRPSGIWDARAPFHIFLKIYKIQQRAYDVSTLCLDRVLCDLPVARSLGKSLESFLVVPTSNRSRRAWHSYERAQTEKNLKGELVKPMYSNTRYDLLKALESLKRSVVVSSFSLFEAYVNCWLLNHLLWELESGKEWGTLEY